MLYDFDDDSRDAHRSAGAVTRRELARAVYAKLPALSRNEAKALVDAVFEEIASALASEGKVSLRGFGQMLVREKRERPGRNPKTGAPAVISARKVITFQPAPALKARVDGAEANENG